MEKLKHFQQLIEEALTKAPLSGQPTELYDPVRYMLSLGGKRMRPALTLLACDLFDGKYSDAMDVAVGIELFHNFTLVHDDIMDKAPLRRNSATVHEKWDQNRAILSGDAILIKAYQQIAKAPATKLEQVLRIFNETALLVCEGQQWDMNFESSPNIRIAQYLQMIELKTAVLIACSLKIGALIGGADEENAERLYQFGKNIGIAFQLQDDILDIYGDTGKFGKVKGGDIISNKKTYLLLKALEIATHSPYKKEELLQWVYAPHFKPEEKVDAVKTIYDQLDVCSMAKEEMNNYYKKAMRFLELIPVNAEKKSALISLTESLMVREV